MTRLVGVRAVCDGCSAAAAVVFCVAHRNVLCAQCDRDLHQNHPRHQRVDLSSAVTALPFCEHCDDAPATTYCESEGTTFCDKCDDAVHSAHSVSHFCTPISRTLRSRGVEFRARSRSRNSTPATEPNTTPVNPSPPQPPPPPTHPRTQLPTRKRNSKALKRKHRRDTHRTAQSAISLRNNDHLVQNNNPVQHPPPPVLRPDDCNAFLQESFPMSSNNASSAAHDPLPMAPDSVFRVAQDTDIYSPAANATLDDELCNMIPYASLDLSGDAPTALEDTNGSGKSASGSLSGGSSHRKSPEFDILPQGMPSSIVNRIPAVGGANSPVKTVVAAAVAAAAAGEMYLLNSVSSGSGSSRERSTTPLDDLSLAPDPAGVAKAATAAAKSAVAAADMQQIAQVNCELTAPQAIAAVGAEAFCSQQLKYVRLNNMKQRASEAALGTSNVGVAVRDNVRMVSEGSGKRPTDEMDDKLDNQSGQFATRHGKSGKSEAVLITPNMTSREGNSEFGVPMSDAVTDDVLRREGDGLTDLDMPRDNFSFDMDLLQFDQNEPGTLGFNMDSDEG